MERWVEGQGRRGMRGKSGKSGSSPASITSAAARGTRGCLTNSQGNQQLHRKTRQYWNHSQKNPIGTLQGPSEKFQLADVSVAPDSRPTTKETMPKHINDERLHYKLNQLTLILSMCTIYLRGMAGKRVKVKDAFALSSTSLAVSRRSEDPSDAPIRFEVWPDSQTRRFWATEWYSLGQRGALRHHKCFLCFQKNPTISVWNSFCIHLQINQWRKSHHKGAERYIFCPPELDCTTQYKHALEMLKRVSPFPSCYVHQHRLTCFLVLCVFSYLNLLLYYFVIVLYLYDSTLKRRSSSVFRAAHSGPAWSTRYGRAQKPSFGFSFCFVSMFFFCLCLIIFGVFGESRQHFMRTMGKKLSHL